MKRSEFAAQLSPERGLEVERLSVWRGRAEAPTLSSISFSLQPSEPLGLMGDSGAGKTSLLRALMGFEPRVEGRVSCLGQRWRDEGGERLSPSERGIAWVPQDGALLPHLTALDNIRFSERYAPKLSTGETGEAREERLHELCERLELQALLTRRPAQLSGGQAQRVALARALYSSAPLLLLDEPLAHLDGAAKLKLRATLCELIREEQRLCLWVSHDPEEALEVSSRLALIHQGRLEGPLSPEQALYQPSSRAFAERFGPLSWFKVKRAESGGLRWGPPSQPSLWPLELKGHEPLSTGAPREVGVRASAWSLSLPDQGALRSDEEREEMSGLTMRLTRRWPHPTSHSGELIEEPRSAEAALPLCSVLKLRLTHPALAQLEPGALVTLRPRREALCLLEP